MTALGQGRLARSWSLIKASAALVRSNKTLLLFPMFSGLSMLAIIVSFGAPLALLGELDNAGAAREALPYVWLFVLYLALYFVGLFFSTALVSVALLRLTGHPAGLREGLARAVTRSPAILGYAVLAATVGWMLRIIEERVGWLGRITAGLIGMTWTVVTFLVIPSLAARSMGPLDALSESAALLKKCWGENLAGNAGLGLVFGIGYALVFIGMLAAAWNLADAPPALMVAIVLALAVALLAMIVLHATLQGVYSAALYCYATLGDTVPGFSAETLAGAFRDRTR
jgi:hypothetical protein